MDRNDFGKLKINRGKIEIADKKKVQLRIFDAVPVCNKDECKLKNVCQYEKRGRCKPRLQHIIDTTQLYLKYADEFDELTLQRIGIMLVPLQGYLGSLLLEQIVAETIIDAKGWSRVHPVYKEIKETMMAITRLEREFGIERIIREKSNGKEKVKPIIMNPNLSEND